METQKADIFVMLNGKFFDEHQISAIREKLLNTDDSKLTTLSTTQFKDPEIILIISLLAGAIGIDRFMIGDVGLGIAKLLTCGGFGIWAIIDLFIIQKATKEKNMQKIQQILR